MATYAPTPWGTPVEPPSFGPSSSNTASAPQTTSPWLTNTSDFGTPAFSNIGERTTLGSGTPTTSDPYTPSINPWGTPSDRSGMSDAPMNADPYQAPQTLNFGGLPNTPEATPNPYIAPAPTTTPNTFTYDPTNPVLNPSFGQTSTAQTTTPTNTAPTTSIAGALGQGYTDYTNPQDFQQGQVVKDQLYPNGQPINPAQLATPQLAQQLAALIGGTVVNSTNLAGENISGTNGTQIRLANGALVNAGLFGDLVSKYGIEQAKKMIQEETANYGQAPNTAPKQQAEQFAPTSQSGPQTQNNFFNEIMNLYGMLSKLGLIGQRPPALQGSNQNSNYFSKFA